MAATSICPRCGHSDTFTRGFLPDTCVCRVCLSQLGLEEIPGMGPDCQMLESADPSGDPTRPGDQSSGHVPSGDDSKAGE